MTINDNWLLDRARKQKTASKQVSPWLQARVAGIFDAQIDSLWRALGAELDRQAGVFNKAAGDPDGLTVTGDTDRLDVRAADGRQLSIRLHRKQQALSERFRTAAGMERVGRPRIAFVVNPAGELVFNVPGAQAAAASMLRRLIE
jgi:hypothetical protein